MQEIIFFPQLHLLTKIILITFDNTLEKYLRQVMGKRAEIKRYLSIISLNAI
jgi:hypothetical protein